MEVIIAQPLSSPFPTFVVRKGVCYRTCCSSDAWMRGARFVVCTSVRKDFAFFEHEESRTRFKVRTESLSDFVLEPYDY